MIRTRQYYRVEYIEKERSIHEIAEEHGTYPNKIRRELLGFGYTLRDKGEAQKAAIKNGRHKHPTRGRERPPEVRRKISATLTESWHNMTPEERAMRTQAGKARWQGMSQGDKESLQHTAAVAVRGASDSGSKLEKYLREGLRTNGYSTIVRHRSEETGGMPVDIYLPDIWVAIDIDGPSHFLPIRGKEVLEKRQEADARKIGAVLRSGLVLIRVIHMATMSAAQHEALLQYLLDELRRISQSFPPEGQRLFEIEVK